MADRGHYYYKDGRPCYELPFASKPGTMRAVTIADARKLGLGPSVTTVQKIINKGELDRWKLEQAIIAAVSNPQQVGEPLDCYVSRCIDLSKTISKNAMDIGSSIHDCLECRLTGKESIADYGVYINPVLEWFNKTYDAKEFKFESNVANAEPGFYYGGRVDAYSTNVVVDWKTQKGKDGKLTHYPEWGEQVAAYAQAIGMQAPILLTVAISSVTPGLFTVKDWSADYNKLVADFKAIYHIWCSRFKYDVDPRGNYKN